MDMSHEFNPSGEGSKTGKIVSRAEQQPAPVNSFDTKIKALFANRNYYNDSEKTSALGHVESDIASKDRFTDNWWEGLYKWMDQMDYHREKYSVAQITFESLDTLPPNAKLPEDIGYWISNINGWPEREPERKQVSVALGNSLIPISLRGQLSECVARAEVGTYGLDLKMECYRIFGQDVSELAIDEMFALITRSIIDEKFDTYREDFVELYDQYNAKKSEAPSSTRKLIGKLSFISKVRDRLNSKSHRESQSQTNLESIHKKEIAEKRVDLIKDIILEVIPPALEIVDKSKPWERGIKLDGYIGVNSSNHKVSLDMSTLPLETLEKYLFELRRLKNNLPEFSNLAGNLFSREGLVSPFVALGDASSKWDSSEYIPIKSVLHYLDGLKTSGNLDDSILDEVLLGMNKNLFSNDQIKPVARRNLRILMKHQLPQETHTFHISPLLTILEENVLSDGLGTVAAIRERDETTADILLLTLPKLRAFGDKYKVVLDYVKRKREREDLRRIGAIKHEDYVSEALKIIQLTDSGGRQGERLVKLAINLDTISELNEALQLGISEAGIVPDLRTSYENAQNTLKGILQKLGIANLDEVYKFLPWVKTKDETALKILRGEEVTKVGEARSYNLQASSKFDLEGMKKEIESYAQTIGIELPEVPVEDLNLESLKQMASYVVAELSKRKDISEEVLREIKPNLDRIRTAMDKGGSYTFSINPQDMKSQLEALQNVGSCLSPGGTMFRYTKEYLKNPNTSWAVIKGAQGAVGRVTMFRGTDESGKTAIARVSKVYAQVPIDESEVDKALRNYAVETNANFVERGKLIVPGLQNFYDDFIGKGIGSVVDIKH